MADCSKCQRTDVKCCYTCKKNADKCEVWHKCGSDCPEHESRILTNADRIRAMSDEELTEFLEGVNRDYDISYGEYFSTKAGDFIFSKKDLSKEILKWLQSEAE